MPVTKSAKRQARVVERRHQQNKSISSLVKTNITKAEKAIFAGELEVARQAVATAVTSLDKAAEKGIIHPNNAARRKSRLVKKLNQAQGVTSTEASPDSPPPENE